MKNITGIIALLLLVAFGVHAHQQTLKTECAYQLASESHARDRLTTLWQTTQDKKLIKITEEIIRNTEEQRISACTRMYEQKLY